MFYYPYENALVDKLSSLWWRMHGIVPVFSLFGLNGGLSPVQFTFSLQIYHVITWGFHLFNLPFLCKYIMSSLLWL
jgi:hypothetical protein